MSERLNEVADLRKSFNPAALDETGFRKKMGLADFNASKPKVELRKDPGHVDSRGKSSILHYRPVSSERDRVQSTKRTWKHPGLSEAESSNQKPKKVVSLAYVLLPEADDFTGKGKQIEKSTALGSQEHGLSSETVTDLKGLSFDSMPFPSHNSSLLAKQGASVVQPSSEAWSTMVTTGQQEATRFAAESNYEDDNIGVYSENAISTISSRSSDDADLRAVLDKRRQEGEQVGQTGEEIDREKKD